MCGTAAIMPRTVGVSSRETDWCMRRRPSAFTVASCFGLRPMIDLTSVILSFLPGTDRLLDVVTGAVAALAAHGVQILKSLDPAEGVDGRLQHVVRVVRAQGLGEDVLHAGRLEHRPHGAAGDDARARHRRLQEYPARAEVTRDLAGNGRLPQRHEDQILLRVLDRLADRLRHLVGLAEPDAD